MTFEGIFKYYPVCIAGEEGQIKKDNEYVKTGKYEVTVLALDNALEKNKNGLYVSNGRSSNVALKFKLNAEFCSQLKFLEPCECLADVTPTSYDVVIKIKKIRINGKFVSVDSEPTYEELQSK